MANSMPICILQLQSYASSMSKTTQYCVFLTVNTAIHNSTKTNWALTLSSACCPIQHNHACWPPSAMVKLQKGFEGSKPPRSAGGFAPKHENFGYTLYALDHKSPLAFPLYQSTK